MKLKSLFLGSAVAAGLSTGAFAADLASVVSSFDVCENLGISGLTISSSDDCLQISGEVKYEFNWGDYRGSAAVTDPTPGLVFLGLTAGGQRNIDDNDGAAGSELDWRSRVDWWLQFVGAAQSDFGTAKAVIKIGEDDHIDNQVHNEVKTKTDPTQPVIKEAYVSIGDTTKLVAGKRDASVFLEDNDEPFGFIGLFHSDEVDKGVGVLKDHLKLKGDVIQLYHSLGNGVTISAGLENLNSAGSAAHGVVPALPNAANDAGVLVGTIAFADDMFTGHVSVGAGGVLDGTIEDWKLHAGATGTFDNFKVRGAVAGGSSTVGGVTATAWNGLLTAEGTFDMFTLAAAVEAANLTRGATNISQWGASLTGSAAVTDEVTIAAGIRWFDANTSAANTETWQAALKLIAKLTESLTATGEVGYYDTTFVTVADGAFYGSAELAWKPGGQFETSVKGEMNSLGAYKATFKASKKFD